MRIALVWVITQRVVIRYVSGQRIDPIFKTLKMGLLSCPETSLAYYHYLLRYNPKERSSKKNN